MPVLNTTHHPKNRETTVLLRPKDLRGSSVAGLVAFVAIYFNCSGRHQSNDHQAAQRLRYLPDSNHSCTVRPAPESVDGKVLDTLFPVARVWKRYTATSNVMRACGSDRCSLRSGFIYQDLFGRSVPTARHSRAGHCRARAAACSR